VTQSAAGVASPCPSEPAPSPAGLVARRVPFDEIPPPLWDRLAAASPWSTPFSRWAFHRAWWDAYGSNAHDQTIVVHRSAQDGQVPVAIVPLMHRHVVEPGDAARATHLRHGSGKPLTPLGPTAKVVFFGASYHADYATILAAPQDLAAVSAALVDALAGSSLDPVHPDPWDAVDLRRLRVSDPAVEALAGAFRQRAAEAGWTVLVEPEDVCPVVDLPAGADLEGFLATLDKHDRHEVRRKLRRARAAGPLELVDGDPLDDLDAFIELHQRRWGADGLFPPGPGGDQSRQFFRRLGETFAGSGVYRLSFLRSAGRRVGAAAWFWEGGTAYLYNAGVDPAAATLSPGVVLLALLIERILAEGGRRVDFLRGDEPYKYEWGAVDEPIVRLLVQPSRTTASP
jgi:CelD/BcsL family acetyltransferase involved in cellulose biosynthesis